MRTSADVIIAGCGAAGLATAYFLNKLGLKVILFSRHPPFSLTSSASTECFRDYWSAPAMRAFMKRSIHLMESLSCSHPENESRIALQKAGYLYVHQENQSSLNQSVDRVSLSSNDLQRMYPWLKSDRSHAFFIKNAGWLSAHGLGMSLLSSFNDESQDANVKLIVGWDFFSATGLEDKVQGVTIRNPITRQELHLSCGAFVNATGPLLASTHRAAVQSLSSAVHASLPVRNDLHAKVILQDTLGVIPRDAPMTILNSPIQIPFDRQLLNFIADIRGEHVATALEQPMPSGAHFRVWGGERSNIVLLLWEVWHSMIQNFLQLRGSQTELSGMDLPNSLLDHELYPDVVLRALSTIVPGLEQYWNGSFDGKFPRPKVDGGYYTRTPENLPLIGPAPLRGGSCPSTVKGMYLCGALSGYGIMGAMAAGELCTQWIDCGREPVVSGLPCSEYAKLFSPVRYSNQNYTQSGGAMETFSKNGDSL